MYNKQMKADFFETIHNVERSDNKKSEETDQDEILVQEMENFKFTVTGLEKQIQIVTRELESQSKKFNI